MDNMPARPRAAPLIAVLLSLAAAGCTTVGPNFSPPPAPTTTGYAAPGERMPSAPGQAVELGAQVTGAWWTLFRSPELDLLVKQAIAGSPTLDSARARLAQAQAELAAARAKLSPQVSLNVSDEQERASASSFGLSPNAFHLPSNFNLFQVGPTASYDLDLFGAARRRIEQQAALADVQRDQLDAAYLTLTGNTVTQAIQVAAARAQQQALADILAIDRQTLELVRKQRQVGTEPDSQVVSAGTQLAEDETLGPAVAQQLSVAQHALAVLTGRAPGDWSPPAFDLGTLTLPSQLPVSLPSQLVHQRPDIQAAEAQLHAASAQIGVATAQLYPDITLSAGISGSSLNGGTLFSPAGLVWSIAGGLTQPIFDAGMRQAQRRAALAAFKASAADYQQTVLQSFGQVADILQALTHDADLLAAQQHALDMAADSVRLQRIDYTAGGIGLLDLLVAQRQYQRARLGYVQAQAQRYQDTIQLLVAMGGGWWDANLAAPAKPHPAPAKPH